MSHLSFGKWRLLDEEVVSALKKGVIYKAERLEQIQPVTVIALRPKQNESQSYDIDNQSRLAHDATSILNRIPAITSIRKGGGYGFDPVLRGFKYDQLNIVIDGVQAANSACPNRMDPPTSQIAPNMMNRIEILKGPHSLRYGTAFGGTINFISNMPEFSIQNETFGRISGNYEGNGNVKRTEGLIGTRGNNYELGVFGSWSQGDDYKDGEDRTVQSDFARGSVGANLGLKVANNQILKFSATKNFATDADFPALAMDLRTDDTWLFNASHSVDVNGDKLKAWNTSVYATFVDHLMDNLLKDLVPRMMNASTNAETKTYGGRTEGQFSLNNNTLYVGADLRIEEADGDRSRTFLLGPNAGKTFYDNVWQDGQISHTGAFAEYHFKYARMRFIASGRLEFNSAKLRDAADEFVNVYSDVENTQINPSFSIGGINNFNDNFSAGLWFGRAQRSGSLTERFINHLSVGLDPYELIGNPNIDPEINNQVDLTLGYKANKSRIDVGLFASFLQDYISSEIDPSLAPHLGTSPGVRRFINIDKALMTGFEVTWNQELPWNLQYQTSVTYTYGQNKVTDTPLAEISPLDFRFNISGSYFNHKFQPEILFRHVQNQDRVAAEFGENETPAFSLIDIAANYKITNTMSIRAGVQNLLDEAYYEHLSRSVRGTPDAIFAPGRNMHVSFVLDLM
jgi:iron complex outermembrane receptor protein